MSDAYVRSCHNGKLLAARSIIDFYGRHTSLMGAWAHELQHRYRQALFGHTPFEETPFSLAQVRGEQVQIVVNVL
jgi:hypothetical protein